MGRDPDWSLHLRFNPRNPHHRRAAEYLSVIKGKYKTAFVVAALEAYLEQHPYGPDHQRLEEIRLASYHGFLPKKPVRENLPVRPKESPPVVPAVPADRPKDDQLDHVIDLYQLDEE